MDCKPSTSKKCVSKCDRAMKMSGKKRKIQVIEEISDPDPEPMEIAVNVSNFNFNNNKKSKINISIKLLFINFLQGLSGAGIRYTQRNTNCPRCYAISYIKLRCKHSKCNKV